MHHEDMDPKEFSSMLEAYDDSFRNMAEGEVVKGTVLKVTEAAVVVDVGYKSEGLIPIHEFLDENGNVTVQGGDTVDVLLERTEDREGHIVLSREKAEKMKIWDEVEKAYADRKVVIGRVIERIKGGLAVDIGVRAFLPGSQIDVRPVRNLDALKGQELRMRVIKVNKKRGNIVLSRKALLEEEDDARDARRGQGAARHGEEHHRLRRVHRPRWYRRPAAHHGHVMGPRRPSVGDLQGQRRSRRDRPEVRRCH
jgi:small subunit ribosomal protein S1